VVAVVRMRHTGGMARASGFICKAVASVFLLACWATHAHAFDCARTQCPDITSCAEARYKLYVCGHHERDADNDGIPCEQICGSTLAEFEARSLMARPKGLPFAAMPKRSPSLELISPADATPLIGQEDFACEGKRRCGQMNSCEEAQFYLRSCGVKSLDRDGDGRACNSLCGGR
jgi:hypothetical protein